MRNDKELAIDCLDRERSNIEFFRREPDKVKWIGSFAFHIDQLSDPMIFRVRESPAILATQSIKQIVEDAGLKGFMFEDTKNRDKWPSFDPNEK